MVQVLDFIAASDLTTSGGYEVMMGCDRPTPTPCLEIVGYLLWGVVSPGI